MKSLSKLIPSLVSKFTSNDGAQLIKRLLTDSKSVTSAVVNVRSNHDKSINRSISSETAQLKDEVSPSSNFKGSNFEFPCLNRR